MKNAANKKQLCMQAIALLDRIDSLLETAYKAHLKASNSYSKAA